MRCSENPCRDVALLRLYIQIHTSIQNTGRNLKRLLRKKVEGICVHVAAKIVSHALRVSLRQRFGIDVLTFEQHSVA